MKINDPIVSLHVDHVHVRIEAVDALGAAIECDDIVSADALPLPGQLKRIKRGGVLGAVGTFLDEPVGLLVYFKGGGQNYDSCGESARADKRGFGESSHV